MSEKDSAVYVLPPRPEPKCGATKPAALSHFASPAVADGQLRFTSRDDGNFASTRLNANTYMRTCGAGDTGAVHHVVRSTGGFQWFISARITGTCSPSA